MDNDGVGTRFSLYLRTQKRKEREHAPALLRVCASLFRPRGGGRVRGKWERWWEREKERERERERERESTFRLAYYGTNQSINQSINRKKEKREKERGRELLFFSETLNTGETLGKTRERIISSIEFVSCTLKKQEENASTRARV